MLLERVGNSGLQNELFLMEAKLAHKIRINPRHLQDYQQTNHAR